MSETPTARATPRKRGEGQWGLGYHEPLNTGEQIKKDDDGLNVRERIDRIFAPGGFRSIGKQDLRSRLRWYGLYTQRKQGVPGERTGSAEPEELEDEFFMMRIRIDGGRLTSDQLRAIAWASERFGRDVADITDRQNVQLHWIRIEDVPAIFERIESVGLTTQEACGDTPRVFLGCPLAGVTADEVLDASLDIRAVASRYLGDPAFSNLPRKYKTSISGCRVHCTNPEINDISLVGVDHPTLGPGYDLQVGGGLSTNPLFAQRLGAFVEPARVPEVWAGVTGLFREYGYRRSRNHARLKFLVKDWGAERIREVLEKEFLEGDPLPDGPAPVPRPLAERDHVGVHEQRDGRVFVGFAPRAGRVAGHQLRIVADLADRFGDGQLAATAQQKLVDPRRGSRPRRRAGDAPRRAGPPRATQRVPQGDHGVHRHRVLQARDRRDQRSRDVADRGACRATAGVRRGDPDPRERLPQLVRAVPGRRHRVDVGAAAADGWHAVGRVPDPTLAAAWARARRSVAR